MKLLLQVLSTAARTAQMGIILSTQQESIEDTIEVTGALAALKTARHV